MYDPYESWQRDRRASTDRMFVINPHNTNDLPVMVTGISVATAGTVNILDFDENECDFYAMPGGIFPQRARRVLATGTSATGIRGHY